MHARIPNFTAGTKATSVLIYQVLELGMDCAVRRKVFIYSRTTSNHDIESECCDGSDESPGICNDTCQVIGEEYRSRVASERKLQKTVGVVPHPVKSHNPLMYSLGI